MVGKLVEVPLREIFPHEERDFTPWLAKNIEHLSEMLNMRLSVEQLEKTVGSFSVDMAARNEDGDLVVVENQLSQSDHDHLGKLLTYATNLGAKVAVWISSDPRNEHATAVEWLNEYSPADVAFFLVRVSAWRIGDSTPAVHFDKIVSPDEDAKEIGENKKKLAESERRYHDFWLGVMNVAKRLNVLTHSGRTTPSKQAWFSAGAGVSGVAYEYYLWAKEESAVEVYIDVDDKEENKRFFDKLYAEKEKIERDFGGPLEWERLDDKRASRIRYTISKGGLDDEARWPVIQEALVEAMGRLSKAIQPHIRNLKE